MSRRPLVAAAAWACLLGAMLVLGPLGCADPIVGEWKSPDSSSYYQSGSVYAPNRMTTGSDNTGKAWISYLYSADPGGQVHLDRFEIEWSESGEKSYDLSMSCFESDVEPSPCTAHDFTMSCELTTVDSEGGQATEVSCTGDAMWTDYEFVWQAVLSE